ncbi:MAG: aldose 1-epimerase family protein, partial [Candidatus Dormibacteraceae bacterium]
MPLPLSGRQVSLRAHDQELTVVEVGGGLRTYSCGGRPVLDAYPEEVMAPGAHGQVLLPWPNRLGGGAYDFAGVHQQTPLSEPELGNAIHGLTRWLNWSVEEAAADRATLSLTLHPQPGYPFLLELRLSYALAPEGLAVTLTARNLGAGPLPFGAGFHPYLHPGAAHVDEARLRLPAHTALEADQQLLPTGRTHAVSGPREDFRTPRRIGAEVLDGCFTDLARDPDGRARVLLAGADGRTVVLWCDTSYRFLQVFTGDTLAPELRRRGLAVEPMTCPADAFRSGDGLLRLDPG